MRFPAREASSTGPTFLTALMYRIYIYAHPTILDASGSPVAYVGITRKEDVWDRIRDDIWGGRAPRPWWAVQVQSDRAFRPAFRELPVPAATGVQSVAEWWEKERVILADGSPLAYRALLIASGGAAREAIPGAVTFRGPADIDHVRTLLDEVSEGSVDRLLFAVPASLGWTLPLYELCLLTGRYLVEHDYVHYYANGNRRRTPPQIGLVTPEAAPLEAFGSEASAAVTALLDELGVTLHLGQTPVRFHDGRLVTLPGGGLTADRVLAMPRLEGTQITGITVDSEGFIRTDRSGRVDNLIDVYAAGDATAFPIKQGGIAAQQAVAAAQAIAADAGADVTPEPFEPVLRGLLVTGGEERYMRSELGGGAGQTSSVTEQALWWPPGKLAAHYLTPYLARLAQDSAQAF